MGALSPEPGVASTQAGRGDQQPSTGQPCQPQLPGTVSRDTRTDCCSSSSPHAGFVPLLPSSSWDRARGAGTARNQGTARAEEDSGDWEGGQCPARHLPSVNPTPPRGTEHRRQSPGDLPGRCQHGWELLCAHGGWHKPLRAALGGDRTELTLPRGCWAPGGLAQPNSDEFCQAVPGGCSSAAHAPAGPLLPSAGKRAMSTRTSAVGLVRQAERCSSPSLRIPWAFLTLSSALKAPSVTMFGWVSLAVCCWAGSYPRPCNRAHSLWRSCSLALSPQPSVTT